MCACCTLTSVQDCLQCRAFPQGPVRICNNLPKHQSLAKAVTWELQEASSDDVLQSHFIYGTSDFLDWSIGYCISHNFSLSLFKIGLWLHPSGLLTFFLHCSSCWSLISPPFPFRDYILFYYLLFFIYISLFSCWVVYRFSLETPLNIANINIFQMVLLEVTLPNESFSLFCKYLDQKKNPEAWNAHLWQIKPFTLFVLKQ